jgi:hypothetical protein
LGDVTTIIVRADDWLEADKSDQQEFESAAISCSD